MSRTWGFIRGLASAGKNVVSVGFPMMSPPPVVEGSVIVSGWDAPTVPLSNSPHAQAVIEMAGYRIDDEFSSDPNVLGTSIVTRFEITRALLDGTDWDCAMLYLGFIDGLGHRLGFGNPQTQMLLERTDSELGAFIAKLPDSTAFIVCSDHGFGSFQRSFSVTQWLQNRGFLALRSHSFKSGEGGGLPGLEFMDLSEGVIDWSRTKAFCWDAVGRHAAIALNTRGQYPGGIVDPREAFELAGHVIDELRAVTDQAAAPIIVDARRREQLFWGPFTSEFPEIFLETVPDVTTSPNGGGSRTASRSSRASFTRGPSIPTKTTVYGVRRFRSKRSSSCASRTLPLPYTRYWMFRSADCDGINRSPSKTIAGGAAPAYSAEEEAIVRKRLEDLGYL